MPRQIKFAFAYGVHSDELELRLGQYVFRHRAHGVADGELAQFLSRDVADQGLLVLPSPGEEAIPEGGGPIVLVVLRAAPRERP